MNKMYIKLLSGLLFVLSSFLVNAQSTANYAFSTNTTGSLALDMNGNAIDMNAGTTLLAAASSDETASAVTNIGFTFWLYGNPYTQFSASSNGLMNLGSTVVAAPGSSTNLIPYQVSGGTVASPKLSAFTADLYVSSTGKVHYKLVGAAPNRCLVVEFLNMALPYNTTLVGGTYQARLYESTGLIEYVYGAMSKNTDGGAYTALFGIGFSVGSAANTTAFVTTATQTVSYGAAYNTNAYAVGVLADLNSAADGSRRVYRFTPPGATPVAPTASTFSAVTALGMNIGWTDNSTNENWFIVKRSLAAGGPFVQVAAVPSTTSAGTGTTYSYSNTGLAPNTTYYFQVESANESSAPSVDLLGNQTTLAAGNITSNATGGGLWSATSTWAGGVVPIASDNVTIANGDAVTIDVAADAYTVTVGAGASGSLQFEAATARTLTIGSNLTILNGASLTSGAGALTTHTLSVGGNIANSGTLNLAAGTSGAGLTFAGLANSTYTGTGTNNLYSILMAKPALAQVMDINVPNFTAQGVSTGSVASLLTSGTGTGTLKFSGTNTFSGTLWSTASYAIPATMGLWINNPNFTVDAMNGSSTVSGLFRLTQGTYNIGTAADNSMGFNAGSSIIVEGGAINAAGRFGVAAAANIFSYTQSAGTITVCTVGNTSTALASFDLGTGVTSTFAMSGGTIIIQLANTGGSGPRDYRNSGGGGVLGVTGGTLQLGNALSGAAKTFNIGSVMPNIVISNASAGHTATMLAPVNYNLLSYDLTINPGTTLNVVNNVYLFNGSTITNNGTLNATLTGCRFITFKPNTNVLYTGTGVSTAPMVSLELQNDLNFTIDPAASNIVVTRIIIFSGSFVNANKLTLGNGGATTATVQIGNPGTGAATNAGTFDVAPTFNLGTGGQVISYLRVINPRVTGPEINPSRVLTNLTFDGNTTPTTLAGGDLRVTGTLTFNTGNVDLGTNTLTSGTSVAAPGTFTYTAGTFIGKFKRWITAATGTRAFPVGVAAAKRNASINYTAAPTTGGTLTAEWVPTAGGTNGLPLTEGAININTTSQNGYWRIVAGDGLTGGTYTGLFTATGIVGVFDYTQLVLLKRADGVSPWTLDGVHVTTTGTNAIPVLSRTGMTGFSEFGIGADAAVNPIPVTLQSFTAQRTGKVNVVNWSTSQEINTSHFILERSTDGRGFTAIAQVTAAGNSSITRTYTYTDNNPVNGINYYRLRIVDKDNSSKYSPIRSVRNEGIADVSVYPNPVNDVLTVSISADRAGKGNMIISDVNGKTVYSKAISVAQGNNILPVDLNNVAGGAYIIKVQLSDDVIVKKFTKM